MTELSSFLNEILDPIKHLYTKQAAKAKELKARADEAKARADEAERTKKVLEQLLNFVKKRWYLHIIDILDKETPLLKKMQAEKDPATETIQEISIEKIYQLAKDESEKQRKRFPAHFEKACNSAGLTIDPESRHPKYSFYNYFFQLEVDEQKGIAHLRNYEGRLRDLPADIDAIIEEIKHHYQRIFDRPFDGNKFIKKLYNQYTVILKNEKLNEGESIPIRRITRRLGKNEKGFRTDEFLVDLSRLLKQGPKEIEGYTIDLQQTKDTNQGMLLYGPAGRGYIGFITFRKVTS
jgi:hypothetical protein